MKKILFIIAVIISISGYNAMGQTSPFEGMADIELRENIISIAKEGILKYAPEFYREYAYPSYKGPYTQFFVNSDFKTFSFHAVTFFYDPSKETMETDFAATVLINHKTGKVSDILLGNGILLSDLDTLEGNSHKEERSTPYWEQENKAFDLSTDEGYIATIKHYKNSALWGNEKDTKLKDRRYMESVYLDDSLRREWKKLSDIIHSYEDKESPNFKLSKAEKIIAIDNLRIQQKELERQRSEIIKNR